MPIIAYRCRKCPHEYEHFYLKQSDVEKDEPAVVCENCNSKLKERLPPKATSHILKGKGWARDNYGK